MHATRTEHLARLTSLRQVQDEQVHKARLLEMNLEMVEEVLQSVNALLARGMDWRDLERLIEVEGGRGNRVAEMVRECRFREGKVVLGIREEEEEEEEEGSGDETDDDDEEDGKEEDGKEKAKERGKVIMIEVDLGLSAYANAREYFDRKKVAAEKVSHPHPDSPTPRPYPLSQI